MENILVIAIVGLFIFLVAREIMCWYWKINIIVDAQEKQSEILERILEHLEQINMYTENEDYQNDYQNNTEDD